MRTTVDLDPVALDILRELAEIEKRSIGKVASDLILSAVRYRPERAPKTRNGIPLLDREPGTIITNEMIDRIREQEGI